MKNRKILWGLVIVLLGVYILCAQFIPNMPQIGIFKALIAIGLVSMSISSIPKIEFFGMLTPLAIVFVMFKGEIAKLCGFDAKNVGTWTVIAATVLCSIGLNILFADVKRKRKMKKFEKKTSKVFTYSTDDIIDGKGVFVDEESREEYCESNEESTGTSSSEGNKDNDGVNNNGEIINCHLSFGSSTKYIDSDNFKVANLECCFGELVTYFDKAKIIDGNATINVDVAFGSLVIYLPKEWNVVNNIDSCFGGIKEKGKPLGTESRVILTGEANFGGVEIHYI